MKSALKLFAALVFLLIIGYVVYKAYRIQTFVSQSNNSNAEDKSVFTDLTVSTYTTTLDNFYTIFTMEDYWETWNIKTDMVVSDVIKVFPDTKELTLDIYGPYDQLFSGINRVGVSCNSPSNVLLDSTNRDLIKGNFDLFEEIKVNDILYAKCLDDSCNNIGKECILIHKNI